MATSLYGQGAFFGQNYATTAPLPACLLSGYPMNEGTGTTFIDVAGVANINMPASSLAWSTSHTGFSGTETASYSGSGTGTFANNTNTNFDGTKAFSVSVWLGSTGATSTFISSINPALSYRGWELTAAAGGGSNLYLVNSVGSNEIQAQGATLVSSSYPVYFVMTYDGSQTGAGVKFYSNGSALGTSVSENNLTATMASGINSALMNRVDGSAPATGVIADLEIYNCVLSPTRVSTNYALGPGIN